MKKTPFGPIPEEWRIGDVADTGKVITGSTPPTSDSENYGKDFPFVTPKEVGCSRFVGRTDRGLSVAGAKKARLLPPHSVVFVCIGSTIGKVSQVSRESSTNQQINAVVCNQRTEPGFLYFQLDHHSQRIRRLAGTQAVPIISKGLFEQVPLLLPPLPEQKKIAEILGACDEAIEAQERLIAQKQQRKKGLMQQLLTGKTRFPQFAGKPWREEKIGTLLREVKRGVDWDDAERYQLLSLRRRSGGPFARESLLGSQIKTKTLKTVRAGDFLIAKMQVTHGALGMVTENFDGWKVSDSYICMVPRDPKSFDVRFFNYLSQDRFIWHLAYVSSYGVAIEKMTFVLKDFLKKEISIPPAKEEASAIANCIDAANEEITLQQNKLEQLKQQKKGLMQQLLTGKVRVAV